MKSLTVNFAKILRISLSNPSSLVGRISGTETVTVVKFFLNFSESFVPVGRTSGTVTVNIAKFFVNFSESFVPVGRTSGTVTVNIVKFL